MEDLATARISVAQTAQRIIHSAKDTDTGQAHDLPLVKKILLTEEEDIVRRLGDNVPTDSGAGGMLDEAKARYRDATKITMQWIRNYTVWDFRSLGSYTRNDLAVIAKAPDAI